MALHSDAKGAESSERLVAVIVGIGGYQTAPLACPANDAMLLADTFKQVWPADRYDITSVVWPHFADSGRDADKADPLQTRKTFARIWNDSPPADACHVTREAILQVVREKAQSVTANDTFLFYFAGHGTALNDAGACLLAIADGRTGSGMAPLAIKRICETAESVQCSSRNKVMILDCCLDFSELARKADFGLPMPSRQELEDTASSFVDSLQESTADWYVLLSCSPGQKSLEDGGREGRYHGVFTAALAQGLKGQARVGTRESIGLLELANYVHHRVRIDPVVVKNMTSESHSQEGPPAANRALRGIDQWIEKRGLPSRGGSDVVLAGQHPMLLTRKGIVGGYFHVTLVPKPTRRKTDMRRDVPSAKFWRLFACFLCGAWPVNFTRRMMLREGGAFLYGATLALTVQWFNVLAGAAGWGPAIGWGIAGALLWWLFVPFAVAANEDCWHAGGYVTGFAFMALHVLLWARLWGLLSRLDDAVWHAGVLLSLSGAEVFVLLVAVVVLGCNAVQGIIALADNIREESDRRDMSEALLAFRQFRMGYMTDVSLSNLVAMVSASPKVYFVVLGMFVLTLIGNTVYYLLVFSEQPYLWIPVLRNMTALVFGFWLTYWYNVAFQFIERDVVKM